MHHFGFAKRFARRIKSCLSLKLYISLICVFVLTFTGIIYGFYRTSKTTLVDHYCDMASTSLSYVRDAIAREIEQIDQLCLYIANTTTVYDSITGEENNSNFYQLRRELLSTFKNYSVMYMFQMIETIRIYGIDTACLTYSNNHLAYTWLDIDNLSKEILERTWNANGEMICGGIETEEGSEPLLTFYKALIYDGEPKGLLYISVQAHHFISYLTTSNMLPDSMLYLSSGNHFINEPQGISCSEYFSNLMPNARQHGDYCSDNTYLLLENKIAPYDLSLYSVTRFEDMIGGINHLQLVICLFSIGLSLLLILIWLLISKLLFSPLANLVQTMNNIQNGHPEERVHIVGIDEVAQIGISFNNMLDQLNASFENSMCNQKELYDMQYQILQNQINPHFLGNTLGTIKYLSELYGMTNIVNIVNALNVLLRRTSYADSKYTTIQDEIDVVLNYCYIQNLTYSDRFEINIHADETLHQQRCIRFILQPLIENAIQHGILPAKTLGNIDICVEKKDGRIFFSVTDNGVGMSPDIMREVLETQDKIYRSAHIGLSNVNRRLVMEYGEESALHAQSEPDCYTRIWFSIPCNENTEDSV